MGLRLSQIPFFRGQEDPPIEVSLAGLQVLQAEATIAICDALAEVAPRDQADALRGAARRLGTGLVISGLR